MLLRAKDVDVATIALWLGHENTKTTHIYEHADPALKERAIARTAPLGALPGRYRPSDTLLAFLRQPGSLVPPGSDRRLDRHAALAIRDNLIAAPRDLHELTDRQIEPLHRSCHGPILAPKAGGHQLLAVTTAPVGVSRSGSASALRRLSNSSSISIQPA
jgi:hypothetical protein